MCIACNYDDTLPDEVDVLVCCENLKKIPIYNKIKILNMQKSNIKIIPEKMHDLISLICSLDMETVPGTLFNLRVLYCQNSKVSYLYSTLQNLEYINCSNTKINNIPYTYHKLKYLDYTNSDIKHLPSNLKHLVAKNKT
jgi:Leucine-rich repeat (LRR) protein